MASKNNKKISAKSKPTPVKKAKAPVPAKKKNSPAKKSAPVKKNVPAKKKAPAPAKKAVPAKKSVPAKKATPPKKEPAPAPAKKKSAPAKKAVPAPKKKNIVPAKKISAPAKKSVPAKKAPAPVPAKKAKPPVVAKSAAKPSKSVPAAKKKSKKNEKPASKNSLDGIVVRRDAETVQTKIITRRRGLIAYTPKELELMFLRRGNANINIFNPAEPNGRAKPATKQILKVLPKSAPRKVGAVSLDELFGYNPFAKNSVSAEEKLIPAKWSKYYKKLVALKSAIQKDIDEHSQTAFSRESKEDTGEISASYSQHTADIDNEAFTRDCALSLLASKQQELAEINIAIERMKKGTYGICEITGKPIPAERLRDVPFTRYSLEGKLEAEKQRAAAARRRRASAATDIAAVTDLENDVPIVFNEDDDAERKKTTTGDPDAEEEQN